MIDREKKQLSYYIDSKSDVFNVSNIFNTKLEEFKTIEVYSKEDYDSMTYTGINKPLVPFKRPNNFQADQ